MLVTLGVNQAIGANGTLTLPYACRSFQKVLLKIDDGASAFDQSLTIQLGQRTICNGISFRGLQGYNSLVGGVVASNTEFWLQVDFGSHQLLDNENLYVTVQAGSGAVDATDVSAIVDEPIGEYPVRYTEFSDNVFTAENVLQAIGYASNGSNIDEDTTNVEIRDSVNSSSPTVMSGNNWYGATKVVDGGSDAYARFIVNQNPLTTTFNYGSGATMDRICIASLMGTNARAVRQGQRLQAITKSQVGK